VDERDRGLEEGVGGHTLRLSSSRRTRGRGLGRDFWIYFAGQGISQLGSSFTAFALPLLVFRLTHSATNLALTMGATFVPYLLFGLVLGAFVDRVNRKRMMVLVDLARGAVIALLPTLYLAGSLRIGWIYAVAFVQATLGILFEAGEFAAIPSLVPDDELVTANGRVTATNSAGQVFGPVLAGALVALMAVPDLLFVDAGTFVVSALALASIRRSFNADGSNGERDPDRSALRSLPGDVREGLRFVWNEPVLRYVSIMMALINFVGATQYAQLVLFAKESLGSTDAQVAWLFAAGSAGVVVVSLAAGRIRRRFSFVTTALGALVVSGAAVAAMALISRYPAALGLWAVASGFGLLLNVNTAALRQAIVPNHLFGRVISVAGVLAWSAIPLGALAGAAAVSLTGVRTVYVGIGVLTALIAAGFALSPIRHGDRVIAGAREQSVAHAR
jgi:MFS family permease